MIITIGGPPGSGKSTVARMLKERISLRYVYAGEIFRYEGRKRGMDLLELSRRCKEDPDLDHELDMRMIDEAKKGNAILEGRMIGPLCAKEGIPSTRIYITASPEIRVQRSRERDGGSIEKVKEEMVERERLEIERYVRHYGIDPSDPKWYDIVIDSSEISADAVLSILIEKLGIDH
ncbi:MAG: cytidylate kinase family protein [Candidatus Thermoplasmatota archaeon]|nr:cytidylate kinase family protein [Candidatus Thermoplasmatota archaeon]